MSASISSCASSIIGGIVYVTRKYANFYDNQEDGIELSKSMQCDSIITTDIPALQHHQPLPLRSQRRRSSIKRTSMSVDQNELPPPLLADDNCSNSHDEMSFNYDHIGSGSPDKSLHHVSSDTSVVTMITNPQLFNNEVQPTIASSNSSTGSSNTNPNAITSADVMNMRRASLNIGRKDSNKLLTSVFRRASTNTLSTPIKRAVGSSAFTSPITTITPGIDVDHSAAISSAEVASSPSSIHVTPDTPLTHAEASTVLLTPEGAKVTDTDQINSHSSVRLSITSDVTSNSPGRSSIVSDRSNSPKRPSITDKAADESIEFHESVRVGIHGVLYRENEMFNRSIHDESTIFLEYYVVLEKKRLSYVDSPAVEHAKKAHENSSINNKAMPLLLPKGFVDITRNTEVKIRLYEKVVSPSSKIGRYCFLVKDGDTVITFAATTSDDRDRWMMEMKEAINGATHTAPAGCCLAYSMEMYMNKGRRIENKSQENTIEVPKKTGSLLKKSSKPILIGRSRRWFKLQGGELSYYADAELKKVKRTYSLYGARLVQSDNALIFTVHMSTGNALEMEAYTKKEAKEWIDALTDTIALLRSKASEVGNNGKKRRINVADRSSATTDGNSSGSDGVSESKVESNTIQKSGRTTENLRKILSDHFLLKGLKDMTHIMNALQRHYAAPGDVIVWQSGPGDLFYILESGACDVVKNSEVVGRITSGKPFGELALLNSVARTATVRASTVSTLWSLDRITFRHVLSQQEAQKRVEKLNFLKTVKLFEQLNEFSLEKIINVMFTVTFVTNERIFKQGESGHCFYMIQTGKVAITTSSITGGTRELARLSSGKCFGELALIQDAPRKATATAIERTVCWTLDKPNFTNILGSMKEAVDESIALSTLRKVKILESLNEKQIVTLSRALESREYSSNDCIIKQGDDGDEFYMVASGEVAVVINHIEVAKLRQGMYFGEMSLISNEKRSATIVVSTDKCCCLVLHRTEFNRHLGNLADIIKADKAANHEPQHQEEVNLLSFARNMSRRMSKASHQSSQSNKSYAISKYTDRFFQIDMLYRVKLLGTGTFASVYLVQHTNDGKSYALKVLNKQNVVNLHQEIAVMRERELMHSIEHPFVPSFYATMQDAKNLFMVTQYVPGGDFYDYIYGIRSSRAKKLPGIVLSDAIFYAANILSAIHYLHDADIAYRDLKLENLVMDLAGYLKLVDFGCAKKVPVGTTNTMCGTPEYIAPETVLSKGHNKAVDYWSFGILIYEMLTRSTPFVHDNIAVIYQNIIECSEKSKTIFNKGHYDANTKDLIAKLLVENPNQRIGMLRNGTKDVWMHPFFKGYHVDVINIRGVPPPYIPVVDDEVTLLDSIVIDDLDGDDTKVPDYGNAYDFSEF